MNFRTAEYPRPDHFLLHLSDTHLLARHDGAAGKLYDRVDSAANLAELFAELEASRGRPEAIVFTGDLADKGEGDAYELLRSIVEPSAARIGAQVIWAMGNHDDRRIFREHLLGEVPTPRPVDRVYDVNGLRVITLDTSVPGEHWGIVTPEQLDWLAEELSSPAPHGTILAMHHPPVPAVLDLAVTVELRDQARLAEVVEGADVRAILAGHLHYSSSGVFAGIPVSVASATCYTQDLQVDLRGQTRGTRARNGAQAFNLVHVYPETVLHSVVPLGQYEALDYVSPEATDARLAEAGIRIPDRVNAWVEPEEPLLLPEQEPALES
ncbi:phosphodiesterase [Gryllotalpicola reticulitermitis]|uniref:Phosphodiesterase n=1 Tax=Gryllotalpicola reticulitermitis TaxID=1184153 RepID=A0ABV8Q4C8_9MICO